MTTSIFEQLYQQRGIASQRRYPNDALIGFLASLGSRLTAEQKRQTKVLELGCGSGANLWFVAREGFSATGIDFAPSGVQLCQQGLRDWGVAAEVAVADMTCLPCDDDGFDIVFDVVSMQHLTLNQHQQALAEAKRVLKKGGLYFSYHLGDNEFIRQAATSLDGYTIDNIPVGYPLAGNGQTCLLPAEAYQDLLEQAGFMLQSLETVTRSYDNRQQFLQYVIAIGQA